MVDASLAYEILLYLNSFYFGMFAACETGIGILKAVNLGYPGAALGAEAGILLAMLVLETLRCILGRRGSLALHSMPVFVSVALTIPSGACVTYFFLFQMHKVRLEYIICFIMLLLQFAQLCFAFLFIVTMCKPPTYD